MRYKSINHLREKCGDAAAEQAAGKLAEAVAATVCKTAKRPKQIRKVKLTLPLPARELSPNFRGHWAIIAGEKKYYRALSRSFSRFNFTHVPPMWEHATIKATFYFKDKRRRDRDNLLASLKSAFDGLQDSGLIANDSGLTPLPVEIRVDRDYPRVEIEVVKQ